MTPKTILVTVATAGTPVQVTTDTAIRASQVRFQPLDGISYLGIAGLNKTTFANCIRRMAVDADYAIQADENLAQIQLSAYWLDVTTDGQKVLVAYWE